MVAEQNKELLLKNHNSRPTGSVSINEANASSYNDHKKDVEMGKDQSTKIVASLILYFVAISFKINRIRMMSFRMSHLAYVCCTPEHFIDFYQTSLKENGKTIEMNFTVGDGSLDINYMDVPNFHDDLNTLISIFLMIICNDFK
ncbi:hypothetical protein Syun_006040 [Stephania yunnanensis]|uniref:Uncharacterized protein n=1 Tax=Stephania yunnanensis TaxID=152371 RepID=A0AAP0PYY4_9MAGN